MSLFDYLPWMFLFMVVIFLPIYIVVVYNGLVGLRNDIRKSWSNIDVLLKQRNDELPRLVETVKGYMKHERETLNDITSARAAILGARSITEKAAANEVISTSLRTIFAVAENYPRLQASQNFLKLQNRISGLENEIADRRELYNDAVTIYNTRIDSIPDLFAARLLRFRPEPLFKVAEEEKQVVQVRV